MVATLAGAMHHRFILFYYRPRLEQDQEPLMFPRRARGGSQKHACVVRGEARRYREGLRVAALSGRLLLLILEDSSW